MITYDKQVWNGLKFTANKKPKMYVEGSCLSSDTKPLNVENGSKLIEMDTSSVYIFDEQGMQWRKFG